MSNTPRKGISWYISINHDQEIKAMADFVEKAYKQMLVEGNSPDFVVVDTAGIGAALFDELIARLIPVEKTVTLGNIEMVFNSELIALRKENTVLREGMKGDYDLDAWLQFVLQQKLINETDHTDHAMRALWRNAGGSFHGPITETGTMPEKLLLPFLRRVIKQDPTKEALQSIASIIAEKVAKNCSSVPQLTFPHIYLGLQDIFDGKYDDIAHLKSDDVIVVDKDSKAAIAHFKMPCTLCQRADRLPLETEYSGATMSWALTLIDEVLCLEHRQKLEQFRKG